MENYIENKFNGVKWSISQKAYNNLKNYKPKNCPFDNYSCFDLLQDFICMYAWKIDFEKICLRDFIRLLQFEGYEKAVIYGNSIITLLD